MGKNTIIPKDIHFLNWRFDDSGGYHGVLLKHVMVSVKMLYSGLNWIG